MVRVSVLAVSVAATLAAFAIGMSWRHERDQAEAVRALTTEVSALRTQLAASTAASSAAQPTCSDGARAGGGAEAANVTTDAGAVSLTSARAPAAVPAFPAGIVIPPIPPIEPRVGDGGRPASAQQAAALASATDLVDAALRRGTISRSEMAILRSRIDAAGRSEESEALRAEIADAIDQGAVVAERAPPVWH